MKNISAIQYNEMLRSKARTPKKKKPVQRTTYGAVPASVVSDIRKLGGKI